jgi:dTDP-4-dehydrorhamnose reductase
MRILVLGHNGMLGNAVHRYLQQFYQIDTIEYRCNDPQFESYIRNYDGEYIINCIGAIPQKFKDFKINTILPIFLELNSRCRIIHPATDCENTRNLLSYAFSKKVATDWLHAYSEKTFIIQSSIIGIELNSSCGLLSWVLNSKGEINGYVDAKWNGITSLEFAKQCKEIIEFSNNYPFPRHNTFSTECISKYELLTIIKEVFNLKYIEIIPIDGIGENRCMQGEMLSPIRSQLIELKEFYGK